MSSVTIDLEPFDLEDLAKIKAMRLLMGMREISDETLLWRVLSLGLKAELRSLQQQQQWAGSMTREQAA